MQFVCLRCGFNMVGYHPKNCPFCGAPKSKFITMDECINKYNVESKKVTDNVHSLNSVPGLGYEHAAYRLYMGDKILWIDCPSTYDDELSAPGEILFTHHHFLGASNVYQEQGGSAIRIHESDTKNSLCKNREFDVKFTRDFSIDELDAYHVNGHTPGFTIYVFGRCLFTCDYVFYRGDKLKFNPFSPMDKIKKQAEYIQELLENEINTIDFVCTYERIIPYAEWKPMFDKIFSNKEPT